MNPEQTRPNPLVVAGTSTGLLFLNSEQRMELERSSITALTASANGLWAIVDRNTIWHRDLMGKWQRFAWINDVELTCILATQGAIFVGTSGACLLRITDNGNMTRINCFDSVEGRETWYTPWGGPPAMRSMAVGPSGELYVNVHVGGILRSDDYGKSWRPIIDIQADVHQVQTAPHYYGLVVAATAKGLAMSQDKGNSWMFDRRNLHDDYARAIAICDETILMSASTGPSTKKAALYRRSFESSGIFEKCGQGLPEWFSDNINTATLSTLGNFAAFGTKDGQIFLSKDVGITWQQIAAGLSPVQCLLLHTSDTR